MRWPPDRRERRPRQESGALDITRGDGDEAMVTRCPLIAAALRIGDYEVLLVVAELHPPGRCPARRQPRPIRFEDIPQEDW